MGMEQDLAEIKTMVTAMQKQMQRIDISITGITPYGIEGLASQVRRHEKYINGARKRQYSLAGALSVLTLAWSFLIDLLFHKFKTP